VPGKSGGRARRVAGLGRNATAIEIRRGEGDMTEPKVSGAEEELDHDCVEDIDVGETEATQDVELPTARGGVEQPDLPSS
jgi:hypothetical protein